MEQYFLMVSASQRRRLVRVTEIQEITALMAVTTVDGQRGLCRGIVNLRGQIVPVFDLSGSSATLSPSRFILICSVGGRPVGLIVDEVHDVVAVPVEQLALSAVGGGRSTMVARWGDELASVLEPADAVGEGG
jgi:purine-binding chemotaxis protein CheW